MFGFRLLYIAIIQTPLSDFASRVGYLSRLNITIFREVRFDYISCGNNMVRLTLIKVAWKVC